MADTRKYVDSDGLKLYHQLSKNETDAAIETASNLLDAKITVTDAKADGAIAALSDLTVTYNLYYVYDTASKKYTYEEAASPATTDYWYYYNAGTAEDPNYQLVDPQPAEGEDISGKNYFIRSETTTDMGGGRATTQEGDNKEITTVIIVPTDTNTIQEDEVSGLFDEEA